ncbi:L-lactate MFS transporter [Holophaga foetida]|uniref:L-lactate MFS transporter n=1 Tax=Holophaga foetida TaxID=35839 RepID=UPI0002472A8C|nr:OFA family MFS transporter [Holophaga foetida]
MSDSQKPSVRGWVVVLAGLGVNLLLGTLYAWGVMGKALAMQWHWTKTQAAMPFAISTASFAIMMVFAGRAQDKLGPRRVASLGGLLFGLGIAASSFSTSPMLILLSFGLVGGAGIGLAYSATTPAAVKWFPPARKGLITGIVVSGVGLAAVFMSPLTQFLLAKTSIPTTFLILGIGSAVIILILAQFLTDPPKGFVPAGAASGPARNLPQRPDVEWHEMLRTPQFYLLWLMYVLTASAGLMIIANAPIIAKGQAHWEAGFVLVMLLAVFNTLGRFISGAVSDRLGRTTTMLIAFGAQAINLFFFARYTDPMSLALGTSLLGLCYGTVFTLMPAITADYYGLRNMGVNYGLVFTGFGVAGVFGSLLGGRVRDLFGSYDKAYLICGVMLVAAAILAWFLRAPKVETASK